MSKRLEMAKKIDEVLSTILQVGNDLLKLSDETDDKELKVELLSAVVILSGEVQELNTFLIANMLKYLKQDIDEEEFKRIMKQFEDRDENGK